MEVLYIGSFCGGGVVRGWNCYMLVVFAGV